MRSAARRAAGVLAGVLGVALAAAAARAAEAPRSAGDLDAVLDFARRTLAFVERSAPRPALAAELAALDARAAALPPAERQALRDEVLRLRRRILFSHPLLDFDRILINQRTSRIPNHMCDQYLGRHSQPGPGLAVLESWKDEPRVTPLLKDKLPPGATMHPDLSFDGRRVAFAFCDHSATQNREHRAYFIYEATTDGRQVRQVTGGASDPRLGAKGRQTVLVEDFDPCYLPDGGLAFISTRSQQYGRCHGSRYVPAYVLYRADADGSNLRQLSFNEANEWDPAVLHDGRIIYTRWDYINRHDTNFQSLWVTRPDGTATAHFYGNYSVGPCMVAEARAVPGSHKVVATATDHHGYTAGSIVLVDPCAGEDGGAPLVGLTPELPFPERGAPEGTAWAPRPAAGGPAGRRAATPFPLSEDLLLVAWEDAGQYAIYLVDALGGRERLYRDEGISCFAPIPLRAEPRPPVLPPTAVARSAEATGRFYVQDVYRSTEPIEPGTIRRLRVSAILSQPTRSKPTLSYVNNEIIKRILGTVPVNADGSVAFEAPADTPLQFQVLDEHGMAVMTMRSLVYLQPGERASCIGCHEPRRHAPAPRRLDRLEVRRLEPPAGPRYEGGFSFARTVQPVLDRYCIGCHGLGKTEVQVNLLGTAGGKHRFSAAYDSLMQRGGLVKIAQRNSETPSSRPKDYFAHAGRLAGMLLAGHPDQDGKPRVALDRESFQRIVDWLDLNAQFYGDYSFNRAEHRAASAEGEKALREAIASAFGPDLAGQPFAALVNTALPAESRILLAPLAARAGGWGQVPGGGWASTDDAGYRRMRGLVEAAVRPTEFRDVAGTCGRTSCACGCCWVRLAREAERNPPGPAAPVARADAAGAR